MAHILVVDDEHGIRELLSEILNDEGHSVDLAENATQARSLRRQNQHDLILLDIWMPDTDGVTLLKEWVMAGQLDCPVIMMSGHATIETAVRATRIGAHSFLEKPITLHKLLLAVQEALAQRTGRPDDGIAHEAMLMAEVAPTAPSAGAAVRSGAGEGASSAPGANAATAPSSEAGILHGLDMRQPLREARDAFERAYFEYHLTSEGASMTRVSERTGLERTHLYRKLRQLGIDWSSLRKGQPDDPPGPAPGEQESGA